MRRAKQAQVFFMGGTEDRRQSGERRRGRPPAQEPGSSLSAWVPTSLHDKAIQVASEREISLSALICQALTMEISK